MRTKPVTYFDPDRDRLADYNFYIYLFSGNFKLLSVRCFSIYQHGNIGCAWFFGYCPNFPMPVIAFYKIQYLLIFGLNRSYSKIGFIVQ